MTGTDVTPVTAPTFGEMLKATLVPVTANDNVVGCPALTVEGFALNDEIVGAVTPFTEQTAKRWLAAGICEANWPVAGLHATVTKAF